MLGGCVLFVKGWACMDMLCVYEGVFEGVCACVERVLYTHVLGVCMCVCMCVLGSVCACVCAC